MKPTAFQSLHAVNLDGFANADALISFTYSLPRRGIPVAYRDYALVKVCAMRARAAGRIASALAHETACERAYLRMPAAWRW